MSWLDDSNTLSAFLQSEGYNPIIENKTADKAPATQRDKDYEIKAIGAKTTVLMGDVFTGSYVVELNINYSNDTKEKRDTNFQSLILLCSKLSKVDGFDGFLSDVSFLDREEKQTKGTIKFYFGIEGAI